MPHIITLGGHHGAGKSTLSHALVEYFGLKSYSTGGFMREMALERGISLIDLGREAERDGGIIDAILDDRQKAIGHTEDNFIIDGRLAFHFIPQGIKVFLTVDAEEAARRIFHDESRAGVELHADIHEATRNIQTRRQSEDDRYMKYYGIHIYDMSFYDIVIDTTHLSKEEVVQKVIEAIEKKWKE